MFTGRTVAIGASGPSLRAADLERCRAAGCAVVVINETWRAAPWADLLYGCDLRWWQTRGPSAAEFAGERLTQINGEESPIRQAEVRRTAEALGLACVTSRNRPGLGREAGTIHQGRTSGYQAINVATLRGARRILLLGYDYRLVGQAVHWHGAHSRPLSNPTASQLAGWAKNFTSMAKDLKAMGVEVVNCTAGSALTCFPMAEVAA